MNISLETQTRFAQALSEAVDARNDFIERLGGFDDFADVHQHVDGNREKFDALENAYEIARKTFNDAVTDKKALIKHLRNLNQKALAERIIRMFSVR